MSLPAFLFGSMIAVLFGAGFHLWKGGNLGRLLIYLLFGWLGFWAGHLLASLSGWQLLTFGPVHYGLALPASVAFLFLALWLGNIKPVDQKGV